MWYNIGVALQDVGWAHVPEASAKDGNAYVEAVRKAVSDEGAQMKYANKIKAPYVVIIGEDELASGIVKIKNMADGSEKECKITEIANNL